MKTKIYNYHNNNGSNNEQCIHGSREHYSQSKRTKKKKKNKDKLARAYYIAVALKENLYKKN